MKVNNGITIFASAMFVPILILGILNVGAGNGIFVSPTLYAVGMLVVFLVAIAAWFAALHGFLHTGSMRLLLIGTGLFIAAFLFLSHGFLSLEGVEHIRGFEDVCAEWSNRLAVLWLGVFLFITIGFSERLLKVSKRKVLSIGFVILGIVLVVASGALGRLASDAGACVAASAGQWTPLGRFLQIASIMLFVIAAVRYLHGAFIIRSETALAFATGIVLLAMSELTYAAVQISYDAFFWASRIWLVFGVFSLLWGTVVARHTPHNLPPNGHAEE